MNLETQSADEAKLDELMRAVGKVLQDSGASMHVSMGALANCLAAGAVTIAQYMGEDEEKAHEIIDRYAGIAHEAAEHNWKPDAAAARH